jgi:hypothetical protein
MEAITVKCLHRPAHILQYIRYSQYGLGIGTTFGVGADSAFTIAEPRMRLSVFVPLAHREVHDVRR